MFDPLFIVVILLIKLLSVLLFRTSVHFFIGSFYFFFFLFAAFVLCTLNCTLGSRSDVSVLSQGIVLHRLVQILVRLLLIYELRLINVLLSCVLHFRLIHLIFSLFKFFDILIVFIDVCYISKSFEGIFEYICWCHFMNRSIANRISLILHILSVFCQFLHDTNRCFL